MRNLILTALCAFAACQAFSRPADAAPKYKYCIQLGADNTQCEYKTMKQCRAAASGLDADCILNPKVAFTKRKSSY